MCDADEFQSDANVDFEVSPAAEATHNSECDTEPVSDLTTVTTDLLDATSDMDIDSMSSAIDDSHRNLEFLLAESDRLIAEAASTFIDLITPVRPSMEVINLSNGPPGPIPTIDLTESPVCDNKPIEIADSPEETKSGPECTICYEDLTQKPTSVTPCGHYFCTECIKKSLVSNKHCPTCRRKCLPKQLYPLYLSN